jgi:acyl-CoA synthetase (AMP-forming)/AMP-acid ligase II
VQQAFEQRYGTRVLQRYGLSELLFISTQLDSDERGHVAVGHLLPGVDVELRSDGEVFVRTPYVMEGYLDYKTGQPDVIDRRTWFQTGDLGRFDGHELLITGRKKDLIIRGGTNVSPRAIEDILLGHEAIADVAVVGVPDALYGEQVIAAIVLKPGFSVEAAERSLEALCARELSTVERPAHFVAMDALPSSITGKHQKQRIRQDVLARLSERASH